MKNIDKKTSKFAEKKIISMPSKSGKTENITNKILLKKQLKKESILVSEDSKEILCELEKLY